MVLKLEPAAAITWREGAEPLIRRDHCPASRASDAAGLGWGQEFAFLTTSQVMLMLLDRGSPSEKPSSRVQGCGLSEATSLSYFIEEK